MVTGLSCSRSGLAIWRSDIDADLNALYDHCSSSGYLEMKLSGAVFSLSAKAAFFFFFSFLRTWKRVGIGGVSGCRTARNCHEVLTEADAWRLGTFGLFHCNLFPLL